MTRVNTNLPQSNPLFHTEQQLSGSAGVSLGNGEENLQVKNTGKWGKPIVPAPVSEQPTKISPELTKTNAAEEPQLNFNKPSGGVPKFGAKDVAPPKTDTKKLEKANALFAGIGGGKSKDDSESDDEKKKKKKEKKKLLKESQAAEESKASASTAGVSDGGLGNLLDFDPKPTTQPTNTTSSPVNLLDDIFSASQHPPQRPVIQFQPIVLNTQQFGELWVQLPPIEKRMSLTLPNISSAQLYAQTMKQKLDFHPVDVINNEVICAAQQSGNPLLAHCRVNPGGFLEFTLKSNNSELLDQFIAQILPEALGQHQSSQ